MVNVPFVTADATTLTQAGYVGEDVESILLKLLQVCNYDIKQAERGIIYIDEVCSPPIKCPPPLPPSVEREGILLPCRGGLSLDMSVETGTSQFGFFHS